MTPEIIYRYIYNFLFCINLIKCQICIPDTKWVLEQGYGQKTIQTSNSLLSSNNLSECMKHCGIHSSDEIVHYSYSTEQCLCLTISQQHFMRTYRTDEETLTFIDFTFKSNDNSK